MYKYNKFKLREYFKILRKLTCLKWDIFYDFGKSKSVISKSKIYQLRKSKFKNTSKFEVFQSKTFVMQKLNNYTKILNDTTHKHSLGGTQVLFFSAWGYANRKRLGIADLY